MSHNAKTAETGFFESRAPDPGRCALCGLAGPDLAPEVRATGAAVRMFTYSLCAGCRQASQCNGLDLVGCRRLLYAGFQVNSIATRPDVGPLKGLEVFEARPAK